MLIVLTLFPLHSTLPPVCCPSVFAVHDVRPLPGYLLRHQPLQLLHLALCGHGHHRDAVAALHQARATPAHQGRGSCWASCVLLLTRTAHSIPVTPLNHPWGIFIVFFIFQPSQKTELIWLLHKMSSCLVQQSLELESAVLRAGRGCGSVVTFHLENISFVKNWLSSVLGAPALLFPRTSMAFIKQAQTYYAYSHLYSWLSDKRGHAWLRCAWSISVYYLILSCVVLVSSIADEHLNNFFTWTHLVVVGHLTALTQ